VTIELVSTAPAHAKPAIHPLIERLCAQTGAPVLEVDTFDDWAKAPGRALVVFTEDPVMYRETLDLAVIVPELAQAFAAGGDCRFRVGVLLQVPARVIAKRYGFRRWPALVMLVDGQYVGAIDGLREWREYLDELGALLTAPPGRAPTIGIAVTAAGADDGHHCH
jgi:hydrogenase-1 operon protein HyaE